MRVQMLHLSRSMCRFYEFFNPSATGLHQTVTFQRDSQQVCVCGGVNEYRELHVLVMKQVKNIVKHTPASLHLINHAQA